jgi:hypothetical protein
VPQLWGQCSKGFRQRIGCQGEQRGGSVTLNDGLTTASLASLVDQGKARRDGDGQA